MRLLVQPARGALSGTVSIPGDKSIGHRALLFSLLSSTPIRVRGLGDGADNGRTAKAITALGATIEKADGRLVIRGRGLDGLTPSTAPFDCGNSGTTIRLLCGLLAGQSFQSVLFGDDSLSKRPMRRVIEPLQRMGALIQGIGTGADITPPLRVGPARDRLTAIEYELPMASAQVKTALLLAGLYAEGTTLVTEPGPSRDHTERMLAYLGAPLKARGRETILETGGWNRKLSGSDFDVPSDPSSSAFLVAAALLVGATEVRLPNICVNRTRTGFLDAIAAMGGKVDQENLRTDGPEPIADLVIRGPAQTLHATEIAGDLAVRSIDELPILAVIAARAHGTTIVRDAEELKVKESDRIASTCALLTSFGVECEARPDGFAVHGRPDGRFKPGHVNADGDHRLAMSGVIAGLLADGETVIDDADQVATSFPGFVDALATLGAATITRS